MVPLGISLTVMSLILLVLVRILSSAAVESDIKASLTRELRRNARYVEINGMDWKLKEGYEKQTEEIFYLIIDKDGNVLQGDYPPDFSDELLNREQAEVRSWTRSAWSHGKKYYIRDHILIKTEHHRLALRGVLKEEEVHSKYQSVEMFSYFGVFAVYLISMIAGSLLTSKLSKEMKDMCRTAEGIGTSLDMSKRMEYKGGFYEICVLTEANNRMLERMEEIFQMQEQFNSDVSHELRTPVAVILAECQNVSGKETEKEELKEVIDVVYRQSVKMNTIITQLLQLSRLEQGKTQLQCEDVDLVEIVHSICEDIQEKSFEEVRLYQNLQEVHAIGDINLIMIVIENFIQNALKFGPKEGPVEIATGEEGEFVYVSVKDYGKGMSAEEQKKVFKRFYKSDKSRNSEGFGLGLSLSMKIAELHGGNIELESEEGKGSKFTLLLKRI